jgi:cytidine deaminase
MKEALLEAAMDARQRAYAPYSNYSVGAAVLSETGQVYAGCNVENGVYPLGLCAERVAIQSMVVAGERQLAALLVVTENGASPCGACRQVMFEFAGYDVPVYIANAEEIIKETTVGALLPDPFRLI